MTPFASVAILEKLALLKIALCKAPVLSRASVCRTSTLASAASAVSLSAVGMGPRFRKKHGQPSFRCCRQCGLLPYGSRTRPDRPVPFGTRRGPSSLRRIGPGRMQACEQVERGLGRFVNFLEIAAPRIARRRFGEQELGEPEDDGELILEVVTALVVVGHRSQCRLATLSTW